MSNPGRAPLAWSWDLPPRSQGAMPRGWLWLQHGFARSGTDLSGLGSALAGDGWAVVRPSLAWWRPRRSMHDRDHLLLCAEAIRTSAREVLGRDEPGVGVGHSAGAAVVGWLSTRGVGVRGLVLLDPVDTVGALLADARLSGALSIAALRPSRCNRGGRTIRELAARGWTPTRFEELSHADPERIPATLRARDVTPPSWAAQRACGPGGDAESVVALGRWTLAAVGRLDGQADPMISRR